MGTDRLDEVLDATYDCLTRYGVRRTTMDDIATTMGVSRSAVYQYVRSKDDAFRRLAGRRPTPPFRTPPASGLAAKLELVLALSGDSPHTAELLDDKARLFGGICSDFTAEPRHLLTGLFAEAGNVEGVGPAKAADICIALVVGLENATDAHRLLHLGSDALVAGLLGVPVSTVAAGS